MVRDKPDVGCARRWFAGLWLALCVIKLALAAHLPVFVDEAFYWQEGQHLAAAYSDLPGLTAWLARLGVAIGSDNTLALMLFCLLFVTTYVVAYLMIVRFKVPRWLKP